MQKLFFICITSLILLFNSCEEKNTLAVNPDFKLEKISAQEINLGDTIVLSGNFTTQNYKIILMSKDSSFFSIHQDSIKFTSSKSIEFHFPYSVDSLKGDFADYTQLFLVFFEGAKEDTSSTFPVKINNYFPFKIKQVKLTDYKIGSVFGLSDETPVTNIKLSGTLDVGIYEINQRTYFSVMKKNHSSTKDLYFTADNISWEEAITFCNELSRLDKLKPAYKIINDGEQFSVEFDQNSKAWRLPTEVEWEFLAKGNTLDDTFENNEANQVAWYLSNSGIKICPSGKKLANINGLYDVNGNVWEWCWDEYNPDFYAEISSGVISSTHPVNIKHGIRRVRRGGSFRTGTNFLRASNRTIDDNQLNGTGLRIIRSR